ncbi:MAG: hypothetical protein GX542_04505 [Rhodococcus sp.]|nr:hypothetical protein [Rhodococcus sp. (in: high G+C Gram-positive bacteria)]
MVPENRLNRYRKADQEISGSVEKNASEFPSFRTMAEIYDQAWELARREVEIDRLFNSWYYEI